VIATTHFHAFGTFDQGVLSV